MAARATRCMTSELSNSCMRWRSTCGCSLRTMAPNSSATLWSTSLDGLFCGSASSRALCWWNAHSPSSLPTMPWLPSRARRVPRLRCSAACSSSSTSRQTNSSLTNMSSRAFTHKSRLSENAPRAAAWRACGSGASGGASAHLRRARARLWTTPLSKKASWTHGSGGSEGSTCAAFSARASCCGPAAPRSWATTLPSSSCTNCSEAGRSRSFAPSPGRTSASRDRNHVSSFAGLGDPALPCAERPSDPAAAASARSWTLTADTACAAWNRTAIGSCCCALGSASNSDRNCDVFSSSWWLPGWLPKIATAASREPCRAASGPRPLPPTCVCCWNSSSMPSSWTASSRGLRSIRSTAGGSRLPAASASGSALSAAGRGSLAASSSVCVSASAFGSAGVCNAADLYSFSQRP
mmetsp:Transcript_44670/g.120349  ORF Transcript_44670/g.120349 Transcript_44670/m.120349 type:complete len:409 (-) Transcript_44670:100-1326(-)